MLAAVPRSLSEVLKEVKAVSTCTLCRSLLQGPRTLPCTHTFCLTCLKTCTGGKKPHEQALCPTCYHGFVIPKDGLESLPANPHAECLVKELTARLDENSITTVMSQTTIKCRCCNSVIIQEQGKLTAVAPNGGNYCYDCDIVLCQACSDRHGKIRASENHEVKIFTNKAELGECLPESCSMHSNNQLRCYCYDCNISGCSQCIRLHHLDHQCANMREVRNSLWLQLSVTLATLTNTQKANEDWMKAVKERTEVLQAMNADGYRNDLFRWLKRLFTSTDDDAFLTDAQKDAKRLRMKELADLNEDMQVIEKQKNGLESYSDKVKSVKRNSASGDLVVTVKNVLNEGQQLFTAVTTEVQTRMQRLRDIQENKDQNGAAASGHQNEQNNVLALPLAPNPLNGQRSERGLTLCVEYGKCRFLWKVQVFSLETPGRYKIINFAPCLCLRHTVCFLHSDTIYAIGAGAQSNHMWQYSPFAPRWYRRTTLPHARKGCGVHVIGQDMYLFGGSSGLFGAATNLVMSFNLLRNDWTIGNTSLSYAVCDPLIMEYEGMIYMFGGRIDYHKRTKRVQVYNPTTRLCQEIGEMPCKGLFHGFRWNNQGIFIGRVAGCLFDFTTNTWSSRRQFKSNMYFFSVALIGDTIHLVGGRNVGREAWSYVDIKTLPLAAFLENRTDITWELKHFVTPNYIRRYQRYTTAVDGVINMNYSS